MTFRSRVGRAVKCGATIAAAVISSCCSAPAPAGEEPTCLPAPANLDCEAAYGLAPDGKTIAPTFEQVFNNTLPNCVHAGCHGAVDPANGLELDDIHLAYQGLLAKDAKGEPRVIPGDVQCGKLIVRLEMVNKPWSMPRGGHLDERNLCSVRHWIANGAAQ